MSDPLADAVRRVLADEESGKGWGPDVTMVAVLREGLEAHHAELVPKLWRVLLREWDANHSEHCSNAEGGLGWPPHPPGKVCFWSLEEEVLSHFTPEEAGYLRGLSATS